MFSSRCGFLLSSSTTGKPEPPLRRKHHSRVCDPGGQFGNGNCCLDSCQRSFSPFLAGAAENFLTEATGSNEPTQSNCSKFLLPSPNPGEPLWHSRPFMFSSVSFQFSKKISKIRFDQFHKEGALITVIMYLSCVALKVSLGPLEGFHQVPIRPKEP